MDEALAKYLTVPRLVLCCLVSERPANGDAPVHLFEVH